MEMSMRNGDGSRYGAVAVRVFPIAIAVAVDRPAGGI
jgi:hypothetical protein